MLVVLREYQIMPHIETALVVVVLDR